MKFQFNGMEWIMDGIEFQSVPSIPSLQSSQSPSVILVIVKTKTGWQVYREPCDEDQPEPSSE